MQPPPPEIHAPAGEPESNRTAWALSVRSLPQHVLQLVEPVAGVSLHPGGERQGTEGSESRPVSDRCPEALADQGGARGGRRRWHWVCPGFGPAESFEENKGSGCSGTVLGKGACQVYKGPGGRHVLDPAPAAPSSAFHHHPLRLTPSQLRTAQAPPLTPTP